MKRKVSIIFVDQRKKEKTQVGSDGVMRINLYKRVQTYIEAAFPMFVQNIDLEKAPVIQFDGEIDSCNIQFVVRYANEIEYLTIVAEGKNEKRTISCLEKICQTLWNTDIRRNYIDIPSYDSISEYYCNHIVKELNSLERNIRNLLLNIYTMNFGEQYYQSSVSTDLKAKVKKHIKDTKISGDFKEQYGKAKKKDDIVEIREFFQIFGYGELINFLFEPHWTDKDEIEKQEFLSNHKDLSELSDEELRNALLSFTPRSEWDRFFDKKITGIDMKTSLKTIKEFRNRVAHFKSFSKEDYNSSKKLIRSVNKKVLEAIEMTEKQDLSELYWAELTKGLKEISYRIDRILTPIRELSNKAKEILGISDAKAFFE